MPCHAMPFACLPKALTIFMVMDCVKKLNYCPTNGGLSISPWILMTGVGLDSKKSLCVCFATTARCMRWTTQGTVCSGVLLVPFCLGNSGNLQGAYKFLCLNSGRVITQYNWTQLPMLEAVIAQVNLFGSD